MSRRARAAVFATAALCAGLAAGVAGAGPDGSHGYGELRDVVVTVEPIKARRPLRPNTVSEALELRRVPERFVPPGALTDPAQAVGRSPLTPIPAGGYVLGSQLRIGARDTARAQPLSAGRTPVELRVEGAAALAGSTSKPVDVVVTTEPGPGRSGRTYVAAVAVAMLDLRATAGDGAGSVVSGAGEESWIATLALSRGQALRLINAESFARSIRLIAHHGDRAG